MPTRPLERSSQLRRDLRLMKGLATGRGFQALVQVTNRCNMQCGFCDFWRHPAHPRDEVSAAEYARFAAQLARESSYVVSLEGGEPLLRRDIVDIVAAFAAQHHPLLYTNGSLMTPELARELFAAGVKHVGVSIDYPGAEHSAHRKFDSAYELSLRAVEALRAAAPRGGEQVHLMTVVMRENAGEMERLLQLSRGLGVKHMVTLLSRKGFRRGGCAEQHLPEADAGETLLALAKRYPHFSAPRTYLKGMRAFLADEAMPACAAGRRSFNVDHLGGVSVCIEKIDRAVGNIRTSPWDELRAKLSAFDLGGCQDCWTLCRGFNQVYGKMTLETARDMVRMR